MAESRSGTWQVVLAPAVLLAIVFACYGHTLNNFFVADDLWQVHYAWKTISGEWSLLWQNFSGNYIGIPGFQLYRPILGLTFVLDFLLWRTNPLGYHLTSTTLFAGNVLCLFYFCMELSREWAPKRSMGFAFFAAALFATTPLHCEAVTWLSGRADILSGFFYMLSLYLVALSRRMSRKLFLSAAIGSFALALGSKEISICLPIVVFAIYFLMPVCDSQWSRSIAKENALEAELDKEESADEEALDKDAAAATVVEKDERSFPDKYARFKTALIVALPFVALSLVYLFIRHQVFGTVFGGYGGAFGMAKSQYVLQKWFDLGLWARVFIPFNVQVIQPLKEPLTVAAISIFVPVLLFFVRLALGALNRSFLLLMGIWMFSTLIPLYGIWDVDPLLHNSRLVFFFTLPLATFLPSMLFQPDRERTSVLRYMILAGFMLVASIAFFCLASAYGFATFQTNQMWCRAGNAVQSFLSEAKRLTADLRGNERIVLLGIPDDYNGAFVLLNGSTLHHLLTPPFTDENIFDKVITFKPFIVGPGDYIDASRLARVMDEPGRVRGAYVWNSHTDGFRQIYLERKEADAQLNMPISREMKVGSWCVVPPAPVLVTGDVLQSSPATEGVTFGITGLSLKPRDWDFLEFTCEVEKNNWQYSQLTPLMVRWNKQPTSTALGAVRSLGPHSKQSVRIGLSQYWKWYQDGGIHTIEIVVGPADSVSLSNLRLVRSSKLVPSVNLVGKEPRSSGEHVVMQAQPAVVAFDAGNVEGAKAVVVEIARPNVFFDASLRADRRKTQFPPRKIESVKGEVTLEPELLEKDSFTQVRVHATDENGRPVGEYSDPVTIYFAGDKLGPYLD